MNEQDLRTKIASRVRDGSLPIERPARTYAGTGDGVTCDCCGLEITETDVQYEVDFLTSAEGSTRTLVAHRDCHRIWQRLTETTGARKRASRHSRLQAPVSDVDAERDRADRRI